MSSMKSLDILVLGCTGVTGRLITKYLLSHPKRHTFTYAISGRSKDKVDKVLQGLGVTTGQDTPKVLIVDITKEDEVDTAVSQAKVVINACGPYWLYGTQVVRACVKHHTHCVDLSGEPHWHRKIVQEFHSTAESDGTAIVNCCGFDSIPSDYGAYMGSQALKQFAGPETEVDSAISIFKMKGGVSKGSLNSMLTGMEVPPEITSESRKEYAISPIQGEKSPGVQFWYNLYDPETRKNRIGQFFLMLPVNRPIVQRSWGLLQQSNDTASYGAQFKYNEFIESGSRIKSVLSLLGFTAFMLFASSSQMARRFIKWLLPDGVGVTDDAKLENGFFQVEAITKSLPPLNSNKKPLYAKTVITGNGDPGYLLTSMMITECALILLDGEGTKKGGVLTPVTAFGDVLPQKLKETGRMDFKAHIIQQ